MNEKKSVSIPAVFLRRKTVACILILIAVFFAAAAFADTEATGYYFRQLDANQRAMYEQYRTLPAADAVYTVLLPEPIPDDMEYINNVYFIDVYYAMGYDCPTESLWMEYPFMPESYDLSENTVTFRTTCSPYYSRTDHEMALRLIDAVAAGADPEWDYMTKLEYIAKSVSSLMVYESNPSSEGKAYYCQHNILGAVYGHGVCDSFSKVFKSIADRIDLPCVEVGSVGHAWVHVLMEDGSWYGVEPQTPYAAPLSRPQMMGCMMMGDVDLYVLYDGLFPGGTVTEPERSEQPYYYSGEVPELEVIDGEALRAELNAGETRLLYRVNEDGVSCTVTGSSGGAGDPLKIPALLDGYTVTAIGDDAFVNASWFTGTLTLPDSVERIGANAFMNCEKLTGDLKLPAALREVGNNAFSGCSGFDGGLFFGDRLESIGSWAFAYCSSLQGSVLLPDSVRQIGNVAFDYCDGLTGEFHIPLSLADFEGGILGMTPITSFSISADHPTLTVSGGVLYNKAMTEVIKCLSGYTGEVVIADTVKKIRSVAIYFCPGVTTLSLPDGIECIERWGVSRLEGLQSPVHLPASLKRMEEYGFSWLWTEELMRYPATDDVDENAFIECIGAEWLAVPEGVTALPKELLSRATVCRLPSTLLSLPTDRYPEELTVIAPASLRTLAEGYGREMEALGKSLSFIDSEGLGLFTNAERLFLSSLGGEGLLTEYRLRVMDADLNELPLTGCVSDDPAVASAEENGLIRAVGDGTATVTLTAGGEVLRVPVTVSHGIRYSSDGKTLITCSPDYQGELTVPEGVIRIGENAFAYCNGITSLSLPSTLTVIGHHAFQGFGYGLTEPLTIPEGVTRIGVLAFENTNFHTDTLIYPSCEVGEGAFSMSCGYQRLVIPDGVTSVPERCFSYCGVRDIWLPASLEVFPFSAVEGMEYYVQDEMTVRGYAGTLAEQVVSMLAARLPGVTVTFRELNASADRRYLYDTDHLRLFSRECDPEYCSARLMILDSLNGFTPVTGAVWSVGNEAVAAVSEDGTVLALAAGETVITAAMGGQTVTVYLTVSDSLLFSEDGKTVLFCGQNVAGAITVPEGVTAIAPHAFDYRGGGITSLSLPSTLTDIGHHAFQGFGYGLTEPLTIPAGLTRIGNYAFCNTNFQTDTLTYPSCEVGEGAFSMSCGYQRLVIPEGVTSVPESCFSYCSVTSIWLPSSLEEFPASAVERMDLYVRELTVYGTSGTFAERLVPTLAARLSGATVIFRDLKRMNTSADGRYLCETDRIRLLSPDYDPQYSVTRLELLDTWNGLTPVTGAVWSVGNEAVAAVSDDGTVWAGTVGETVVTASVGGQTVTVPMTVSASPLYSKDGKTLIRCGMNAVGAVTVPEGVTVIGPNAFYDCNGITSLSLPSTLTEIGNYAFQGFGSGLTEPLAIPSGVKRIGQFAFNGAYLGTEVLYCPVCEAEYGAFATINGIDRVVIPEGVTRLPEYGFGGDSFGSIELPFSLEEVSVGCFDGFMGEALTVRGVPGSRAETLAEELCGYLGIPVTFEAMEGACSHIPDMPALLEADVNGRLSLPSRCALCGEEQEALPVCTIEADPAGILTLGDEALTVTGPGAVRVRFTFAGGMQSAVTTVIVHASSALRLPEGLEELGDEAFLGTAAAEVVIPRGCERIGSLAFADSPALRLARVPASVNDIAPDAFEGSDVVFLLIDGENPAAVAFAEKNGLAYVILEAE